MSPGSDLFLPASLEDLSRIVRSPAAAEVLRDGQQAFPAMLGPYRLRTARCLFREFHFSR